LHQPRYHPPYAHAMIQNLELELFRCELPVVPPRLYQDLLYEGPIVEPIQLEPERVWRALTAVLRV
jgi:hypothetical protein